MTQVQIDPAIQKATDEFRERFKAVREEIGKAIVGHEDIIHGVLTCLFTGGHALLEGVPGLGKTYLIRSMSEALSLRFSRIQFTPDLMPADIIGTNIIVENAETGRRGFEFQHGPLFAQLVLADEVNRATPKTQSALLEAMQEKTVTTSGSHYELEQPFFVMATQNPIEQEGTYPLPEAQLDRFFFKLVVKYSTREQLSTILDRTTTGHKPEIKAVMSASQIIGAQRLVQRVIVANHVKDYAIRLVLATHPRGEFATEQTNRYVRWGSSPRGAQALTLAAKVNALLDGRFNVSFDDIRKSVFPALRHRVLLNFEAQAEGIESEAVLQEIVDKTPTRIDAAA
ncbi:MAG: MoxR family ATPase [Phycisphaerae bacterium]|nr:MoxR family ATPase [Phycisphaerae bacterium]